MKKQRLKKLALSSPAYSRLEIKGAQHPFGNYDSFPNQLEFMKMFVDWHQEFPEWDYFDFEGEWICLDFARYDFQWYLVGCKY